MIHAEVHRNWVKTIIKLRVLLEVLNEKNGMCPCWLLKADLQYGTTVAVHKPVCRLLKIGVKYQLRWPPKL